MFWMGNLEKQDKARAGRLSSGPLAGVKKMKDKLPIDRAISWEPKVRPQKIRRLYQRYAAQGIVDEDQIDDVGYALYCRCKAIWCVTELRCPECKAKLDTDKLGRYSIYNCPGCGWRVTKRRFRSSYKRKRLVGGSAYPAFQRFLKDFESAKDPHQKMLAIDRLIHAFHGDYQGSRARLRRTACSSVLEGDDESLAQMLDELAYGDNVPPEMLAQRDMWRAKVADSKKALDKFRGSAEE
jgi:hypothetical protein